MQRKPHGRHPETGALVMGDPFVRYSWQAAALDLAEQGWPRAEIEEALNLLPGETEAIILGWRSELDVLKAKHTEMRERAREAARMQGEPEAVCVRQADAEWLRRFPIWTGRKPPLALVKDLGIDR